MGFDAKLVFVRSASPVSDVTAVEVPAASARANTAQPSSFDRVIDNENPRS